MKNNRSVITLSSRFQFHFWEIFSSGTAKVDDFVASPSVNEVKVLTGKKNHPGTYKILVGNWVAQWDSLYRAWFYYNTKTDTSTWDKPKELVHVSLNPPKGLIG